LPQAAVLELLAVVLELLSREQVWLSHQSQHQVHLFVIEPFAYIHLQRLRSFAVLHPVLLLVLLHRKLLWQLSQRLLYPK
jgi:hypothetical protein